MDKFNVTQSASVAAYLYPWDAVGDPSCPQRLVDSGIQRVVLAGAYHSVRAVTPHHPEHAVVTAQHSAVYYSPSPQHWAGSPLTPTPASWAPDSWGVAASALRSAGLGVHAWVVLTHNQRLGFLHPDRAVTNAFSDSYPWALCPAAPDVVEYASRLAAEAASQPGLSGIELESCGWYGFDHGHVHDKTGAAQLPQRVRDLLSWCFCRECQVLYAAADVDPARLRALVVDELSGALRGGVSPGAVDGATESVVLEVRARVASTFRRTVVDAVRTVNAGLPVWLHTHPDPTVVGANPGASATDLNDLGVGAVVAAGPAHGTGVAAVQQLSEAGVRVAANFMAVERLGGAVESLAQDVQLAVRAGASEVRFYHAGLATTGDLSAMRRAAEALVAASVRS